MSGTVNKDPRKLKEHPENRGLYEDDADAELVESIKSVGIVEPLLILRDDSVVSGHRRRDGAIKAGLKTVPCRVDGDTDPSDAIAVKKLLLSANRYRVKTREQVAREVAAWEKIEAHEAAERMAATQAKPGEKVGSKAGPNLAQPSAKAGRSIAAAAERVGVKRETAKKMKAVVAAIEAAGKAGDTARVHKLRELLNNKSVDAAYREATGKAKKSAKPKPEKPKKSDPSKEDERLSFDPAALNVQLGVVATEAPEEGEVDADGVPSGATFRRLLQLCKEAKGLLTSLSGSDAGAHLPQQTVELHLRNFREAVKFAQPWKPCPECGGTRPGCKLCKGCGFIAVGHKPLLSDVHKSKLGVA